MESGSSGRLILLMKMLISITLGVQEDKGCLISWREIKI